MKLTVVIPIYKESLSKDELASLLQCFSVLKDWTFCFIAPKSLHQDYYKSLAQQNGVKSSFELFEDKDFTSVNSYSKLLLDVNFYKRFTDYDFIFLYQLDGWVFRDELNYWCEQDYDYIGAPWFKGYDKADEDSPFISPSGNGGVSLRKIQTFIETLSKKNEQKHKRWKNFRKIFQENLNISKGILKLPSRLRKLAKIYLSYENSIDYAFNTMNEDYIIVNIFPKINKKFKIAPNNINYKFSFEVNPEKLYNMNNKKLPFACHAHKKYGTDFWNKFIDI